MTQFSLIFDGVDDLIEFGNAPPTGSKNITIELFVWIESVSSSPIFTKWTSKEADQAWSIGLGEHGGLICRMKVEDIDSSEILEVSSYINHAEWTHIALVWNGDLGWLKLFINGILVNYATTSGSKSCHTTSTTTFMGYNDDFAYPYFEGMITYARITDEAEYDGNFDIPRAPAFPNEHTVCQWDFIEGSGFNLNNREGTADYDGIVGGAAKWSQNLPVGLWGSGYEQWGDEWTIFVDDVNVTPNVTLDSISITQELGSNRDTAVFRMQDIVPSLRSWMHVTIWHGGELKFGGVVMARDEIPQGIAMDVICHCVDWTVLLDKRIIAERVAWEDQKASEILTYIFENYVPEVTVYADGGATGLDVENDYGYVSDLVTKLAAASNYYWFVREDEEGSINLYFSDDELTAPFSLSTNPDMSTSMPVRVLQWSISGSDIVNDFYLIVEGAEGSTVYTTGGTLGNVHIMDDRNIVQMVNSASAATYGVLSAMIKMGQEDKSLYNTTFLTSLGEEKITGRIEIRHGGVRPGMKLIIYHSVLGIDAPFLVHLVRIKPLGGSAVIYEISVSNDARQPSNTVDTWRKVLNRLEMATIRPRTDWVKRAT